MRLRQAIDKKNIACITTFLGIVMLVIILLFFLEESDKKESYTYSQEYIVGSGNIKGNVDKEFFESVSSKFKIGANKQGYAVFKNPDEAIQELQKKYSSGISLIRDEFELEKLSNKTMEEYKELGNQVIGGTEEEKEEASFVSAFLDIYENSFGTN